VTSIDFARVFTMSAFEGLRILRLRQTSYPNTGLTDLAELVRRVDPDGSSHDFDAAFQLDPIVISAAAAHDVPDFYQHCIEAAIPAFRPLWGRIITLGRSVFVQKLSRDEVQCFRSAGLLEDPPTRPIISWWDRVAAVARLRSDQEKMVRARQAEEMSLAHEAKRLAQLGIEQSPLWMSIEDNTAGYDIQSFDPGAEGPVARLIEVKSTIASPLRFWLSRNEWETAKKYGSAYHFHIWDLKGPQLHERTAAEILRHIPTDNERGKWANVLIPIIQGAG
jgi:Domain of unknown function (DUF3883)